MSRFDTESEEDSRKDDLEARREGKMPKDMLERLTAARTGRSGLVPMWDIAFEFLRGNQTTRRLRKSESRLDLALGSDNVRAISNRLLPIYRSTMAALSTQFPHFKVNSSSPSFSDITKRIASSHILNAWWTSNRMEVKWMEVVKWLSPGGNAALWTFYDPVDKEVRTEVVGCYDIVWEDNARSIDEADWAAVRRFMVRSEAIKRWPDFDEDLSELASSSSRRGYDSRGNAPDDRLEVWYVYFKDGRCGIWAGGASAVDPDNESDDDDDLNMWLEETKMPDGIFPIAFMRWTPFADRVYGLSQLWPLLDMQVQYNLYRKFMLDSVRLMANPVWLISNQARVAPSSITNKPGQVIKFNQNAVMPQRLPGPSLSSDVYEVQNRQLAEIEDLANIHNVSMGKRAPGLTANVSMQTLIEQDMQGLYLTMQEMNRALEEAATCALVLWKAFMPKKKAISILDPVFGVTVMKEISRTEIMDTPDVSIESGSMFAVSTKERDAKVLQLAQLGAIPPEDVMKHLSFKPDQRQELEKMQLLSHASDLLAAVLGGNNIELVDEPSLLMSVLNVFGEFIRSPAFFEAKPAAKVAAQNGDLDAKNAMSALENVWVIYNEVQNRLQQGLAPQQQPQTPGSLPGDSGASVPGSPGNRNVETGGMNPTAGASADTLSSQVRA